MTRQRTSDLARLEQALRNLSRIVPGYPLELAFLSRLSALLEKRMSEAVNEALRPLDLTYVLYHAMVIIHASEDGVAAPTDIAELSGERPNNVTHICNHLEELGYITRRHADDDRRRIRVLLTAAGRRMLGRAQPLVWEVWRQRFQGIDAGGRELLAALVRRQLGNLDAGSSAEAQP